MGIDEGSAEGLTCTDGLLLVNLVRAVWLLEQADGLALAEEQVGGTTYEGITVALRVGVARWGCLGLRDGI